MRGMLLLMALLGLAASLPAPEVERLLRAGQQAHERGDYRQALDLLAQVEPFADDPGPVTFALANTHYRLALQNGEDAATQLAQATTLFRCLVEPGQPYQARATVGLGACLLLRATRARDHALCEEALKVLETATGLSQDPSLQSEARRLFNRARLLEWQLLPGPPETTPPEPLPPEPEMPPKPLPMAPEKAPAEKDPSNPKNNTGTRPTPTEDPRGTAQEKKDGPQGTRAAEGNQASVQDRDPLPPALERDEAVQKLREATRRIQAEQKAFRRSMSRPPTEGVPDW